jgi:hypothetical protein
MKSEFIIASPGCFAVTDLPGCFTVTDLVFCFSPDDRRAASPAWIGFLGSLAGINAPRRSGQSKPITKLDPAKQPAQA